MGSNTGNEAAQAVAVLRSAFDGSLGEDAGLIVAATVAGKEGIRVKSAMHNLSGEEVAAVVRDAARVLTEAQIRKSASKVDLTVAILSRLADKLMDAVTDGIKDGLERYAQKGDAEDGRSDEA